MKFEFVQWTEVDSYRSKICRGWEILFTTLYDESPNLYSKFNLRSSEIVTAK